MKNIFVIAESTCIACGAFREKSGFEPGRTTVDHHCPSCRRWTKHVKGKVLFECEYKQLLVHKETKRIGQVASVDAFGIMVFVNSDIERWEHNECYDYECSVGSQ